MMFHRCELLSFIRIFGIQHNFRHKAAALFIVVNCFHLSVSLGYNTTSTFNPLNCSGFIY